MVIRVSDKKKNYSKVTKLLVKPKALRYAKANRELKSKIYLDEATGLPNKNKCEEILTLEAEQNMAICVFDLNNLRIINNQQGHERGDLYIRSFAKSLRKGVDENQFVGRCGGDEFMKINNILSGIRNKDICPEVNLYKTLYEC